MYKTVDTYLKKDCLLKLNAVDDYLSRGGLLGYTQKLLTNELNKALLDKMHPLHNTAKAIQSSNHEEAYRSLITALSSINLDFPFDLLKLVLVKLPAMQLAIQEEKARIKSSSGNITIWAAMEIANEESNHSRTATAVIKNIKYTKEDRTKWKKLADEIDPQRKNKSNTSREIAKRLKLPETAIESIRKAI